MALFNLISEGFLIIRIQNVCRKATLMCLIQILVWVVNIYDGIICCMTPFKDLKSMNEAREVLIHIKLNAKIALTMANSADPEETPRLIWVYAICKCSLFRFVCTHALTTSKQLRTFSFRQAPAFAS